MSSSKFSIGRIFSVVMTMLSLEASVSVPGIPIPIAIASSASIGVLSLKIATSVGDTVVVSFTLFIAARMMLCELGFSALDNAVGFLGVAIASFALLHAGLAKKPRHYQW